MEQWVHNRKVFEGRIVSVRSGEVRLADGTLAPREVVEHPGGVGVLPVLDSAVLLIRQYRIAVGREILEIPAGKLEPGDTPLARARHELEEETGYRAERLEPAGSVFASVGYTSEEIHLFLAYGLEHIGQRLEFDERIEVARIPLAEARRRVAAYEIQDAKTLIALEALFRRL